MSKPSFIPSLLLILCSLSISSFALETTQQGNYFYVSSPNTLSYELYQTRNGIIGFSIEALNKTDPASKYVSQYVLIDLPHKDAKPVLTDTVKACELVTPTFQNLHYHVQTDTVSYFCYGNNSLLLIDQSNYQVKTVIPFNISGGYPVAKISTEGMGIAVLLMGDLFTTTPKASFLVKVDLQARAVTAEIWLNQGFSVGEAVVAYASGKKGAYIATNRIQGSNLAISIYSIITIGKQYQLTPLSSFNAPMTPVKIVTKLFSVGSYLVVNNGQDVYFINQQGSIYTQVKQVFFKSLTSNQQGLFHLAFTAQIDSTDLYIQMGVESVFKYSVLADGIHYKQLGGWGDMQIAYGNSTSGDLMFTTDYIGVNFTVFDVQTMKPVYSAISGFEDLMVTDKTYAVVQSHNFADYNLYIFDLKTDALIFKMPVAQDFYYTKEQHIISYFVSSETSEGCSLLHIDLTNGKNWTTFKVPGTSMICDCSITKLRLTEKGNPEFVMKILQEFMIVTEAYGTIHFKNSGSIFDDYTVNMDFDKLSFYLLDSDSHDDVTYITSYAFNSSSNKFEKQDSNMISHVSAKRFAFVNTTRSIITNNFTAAIIDGIGKDPQVYIFSQDWNFASAFQDLAGNECIILSKNDMLFVRGSAPAVLISGNIAALPGMRKESVRAEATGANSYFIEDELYQSFGLVRFYKAGGSSKTMISI